MNSRQEEILKHIVDAYVETAEPVSSKQLCDKHGLMFSSATVRNDMVVLEAEGYIHQPHTSAGRVPTEKGYRHYLTATRSRPVKMTATFRVTIRRAVAPEERMLSLGKELARMSGEAVLLSTTRPWSAVIGLSNLLRKPDFRGEGMVLALAEEIEAIDRQLLDLAHAAPHEVTVWLGKESPFGHHLATVVTRCDLPGNQEGCLAIVGPIRMEYGRNIALLTRAKEILRT